MKKDTLFSLPMERKTKYLIIICSILAVIAILLYIILCFFSVEEEVSVVYPSSGLSQSIFDSQNMVYGKVEGFSKEHVFSGAPFTIDTVDGQKAVIGNGSVYQSSPYYFYYSTLDGLEDVSARIRGELTGVLLLSADPLSTSVVMLAEESGYVNGCDAKFYVAEIDAVSGKESEKGFMCFYVLDVNDVIYGGEKKLLIGCMSKESEIQTGLENLKQLALANISTLQYKSELEGQEQE